MDQIPFAFSQDYKGIYKTAPFPVGAMLPAKTSDNVLEFPVKPTKAVITLKLDGSNPKILKGRWTSPGKTITLVFQPTNSLRTINMEFVKMKSGEYIKLMNSYFEYYKKE